MDANEVSEHGEEVDIAPAGWEGGDLAHTGGNLFAHEWVHSEKELRVGYSVDDPSVVGAEEVAFEGDGDEKNPQMWRLVGDVESQPCNGEEYCLETAIELMEKLGGGE
ncbi:hypothetical protein [Halobaculum sp. D14]|uniref:hypothetical protein n=1 Tax=Halobaculum sp. D14 TaxID=3421642 RepID=UPI003EC105EB